MKKSIVFGFVAFSLSLTVHAAEAELTTGDYKLAGCKLACKVDPRVSGSNREYACKVSPKKGISIEQHGSYIILNLSTQPLSPGARDLHTYPMGHSEDVFIAGSTQDLTRNSIRFTDINDEDDGSFKDVITYTAQADGSIQLRDQLNVKGGLLGVKDATSSLDLICKYVRK